MLSPKYFLYLAVGSKERNKIQISSNPKIDAGILEQMGYHEIYIIQPPQPVWIAEIVLQKISQIPNPVLPSKFQKIAVRLLNELIPLKQRIMNRFVITELLSNEFDLPEMGPFFWGRALLGPEIPELIKSNGLDLPWDPEDWLQYNYLTGQVKREAAVTVDTLGIPLCRRCGQSNGIIEDNCIFCGSLHCLTCTNCQTMGLAKSCIPLYSQPYPDYSQRADKFIQAKLKFELTPPQQRASMELIKFLEADSKQFLVWAVCGGGKTEVSFGVVGQVLSAGGRVLFAIPRKDVVIELLPRFQKAFPEIPITALFGGSGERFNDTPLTIATTHQCLRFYQAFDLIVLDEADAFPYQGSKMLHYAIKRSLKADGRLVIMTATPDQSQIQRAYSGKLPYVSIPARHHRKPLILPDLVRLDLKFPPNVRTSWEPPEFIQKLLYQSKNNCRKVLIFLPTIKLIEGLGLLFVKWGFGEGIPGQITHSKAANREEIKTKLLDGEILFTVTSTIFERGITIPNLDVIVLHADHETIFNCQTLVQIAGRAGRLGEPAQVCFIAKTISKSMKEACQTIATMNEEGYKLGYLDRE